MKTTVGSLFGAMLLLAAAAHGGAETATSSPADTALPSMQRDSLDEISATVTGVDPKTRMIELRGKDGQTGSFEAGPEVKNFAQIRKGDKVDVVYAEALAVEVRPQS